MLEIHFGSRLGFRRAPGCPPTGRLLKYMEETFTLGTLRLLVPGDIKVVSMGPLPVSI